MTDSDYLSTLKHYQQPKVYEAVVTMIATASQTLSTLYAISNPTYMIKELTDEQYKATMASKMLDITASAEPVLDIWPYVATLEKHGIVHPLVVQKKLVEHVYRSEDNQFDHVLLPTSSENKFVAIVIDVKSKTISGYYNLDLTAQYF